jgi:uncharacterized protein YcbK (DUF882 family)
LPNLHRNIALPGQTVRSKLRDILTKLSVRAVTCACLLVASVPFVGVTATEAVAETRSLKLYYVHTREKATITFKRNGRYDAKGLQELNRFLRDWRRNQPTRMDPRLFDLVWEVYRRSGATEHINVVSAFRAPETNNMLRSRTKGVAKSSQHTLGKAMDFYIPGVKISRLREIAMQLQIGGVGYYPKSGSPFVHLDVGSVRAWPRMSRQELVRIFPKGNTIHLPSDGKPLPGYEQAMADYKRRVSSSSVQVASTAGSSGTASPAKRRTLLQALFGGGDEDEDADSIAAPAPTPAPNNRRQAPVREPEPQVAEAPVAVASLDPLPGVDAPFPTTRPAFQSNDSSTGLATALYSTNRNPAEEALRAATTPVPASAPAEPQFADLAQYSVPVPTLLGPRNEPQQAESVETAALGEVSMPVPVTRPVVAEALLQTASLEEDADAAIEQEAVLSPQVIAALSQSASAARNDLAAPAGTVAIPDSAVNHRVSVQSGEEVAALPETFGDAFDVPAAVADRLTAGLPAKGARPSKRDADVAYRASVSGGQLTQNSISDWALSQNKGVSIRSVKAPRVVNRLLSHDVASSASSRGFQQGASSVDSSRFSTPVKLN